MSTCYAAGGTSFSVTQEDCCVAFDQFTLNSLVALLTFADVCTLTDACGQCLLCRKYSNNGLTCIEAISLLSSYVSHVNIT